jgi:hypothetical protein
MVDDYTPVQLSPSTQEALRRLNNADDDVVLETE